ncbi:hypothetical protein AA21291_1322 [Swaminathania salitolerans LMG 21291]|nr:hypothetical protein AA21291_1322 [Swaminathania salitolerans LMG 21291]
MRPTGCRGSAAGGTDRSSGKSADCGSAASACNGADSGPAPGTDKGTGTGTCAGVVGIAACTERGHRGQAENGEASTGRECSLCHSGSAIQASYEGRENGARRFGFPGPVAIPSAFMMKSACAAV